MADYFWHGFMAGGSFVCLIVLRGLERWVF